MAFPSSAATAHSDGQAEATSNVPADKPIVDFGVTANQAKADDAQKWKFRSYYLTRGSHGGYFLQDETLVRDPRTGEYRPNVRVTSITLTRTLTAKLAEGSVTAAELVRCCNEVRRSLDERGVKVFFDKKKENGKIYPKWKYTFNGEAVSERIMEVPLAILELVRDNPRYFAEADYRNWYGPLMQAKREQLITGELARLHPETSSPRTLEALRQAAISMVAKVEQIFSPVENPADFVKWSLDFTQTFTRHDLGAEQPSLAETERIVRGVIAEKFASRPAVLAKIDRYLPGTFAEAPTRADRERALFERMPKLNAEGVRINDAGHLIALADRQDVNASVSRVLRRITESALNPRNEKTLDEAVVAEITAYMADMLLGKKENSPTRERFTTKLASFNEKEAEIQIHNIDGLVATIIGLAEQLGKQSASV